MTSHQGIPASSAGRTSNPVAPMILALSGPRATAETILSVRSQLNAEMNGELWRNFLIFARKMRVAPLISWNVDRLFGEESGNIIPEEIAIELAHARQREVARNRMIPAEVNRVVKIAESIGVSIAVRKGAYLAQCAYPEIGLRPMGDIDLLAHPEQADILVSALDKNGYQEGQHDGSRVIPLERQEKLFWRLYGPGPTPRCRLTGDAARPVLSIDISTTIHGTARSPKIPTGQVLERATAHQANDVSFPVLSPEDMVLDLLVNIYRTGTTLRSINLGKHRRLTNFIDVVEFINLAGAKFRWPDFLRLASRYEVRRPVLYALLQLDDLYPGVIPSSILDSLREEFRDWPILIDEYGHLDLDEPKRWPVDFKTRLFDDSFDRDVPRTNSPV